MHPNRLLPCTILVVATYSVSCQKLLDLDGFHVQPARDAGLTAEAGCQDNAQCPRHDDQSDPDSANRCTRQHVCAQLRSDDCEVLAGTESDRDALLIGSLFSTTGPEATSNRARQNSVRLAVEEINAAGGIPSPAPGGGAARTLLLLGCDATRDALRAADHLVELHALAIVGPDTSETLVDISQKLTIAAQTVLLAPTELSSDVNDLRDDNLDWAMAPTSGQRAPLMLAALEDLERQLTQTQSRPLKLSLVFRDDAVGRASMSALQQHRFQGMTLAEAAAQGDRVRITRYDPASPDQSALVASQQEFAPDIMVLVGQSETITAIMGPLERAFAADGGKGPQYLVSEASKVPALLALAQQLPDLRARVRGVGVTPTAAAVPVQESFQNRYDARFGDGLSSASGASFAYDATYAIAYALSRVPAHMESGVGVAGGFVWLSGADAFISVGTVGMSTAFRKLGSGERIAALGTMAPLRWDERGGTTAGAVEVWCLGAGEDGMRFAGSGLALDVSANEVTGSFAACTTPSITTHVTGDAPTGAGQGAPTESNTSKPMNEADGGVPPAMMGEGGREAVAGSGGMLAHAGAGGHGMVPPPSAAGASAPAEQRTQIACGQGSCNLGGGQQCCIAALRPYTGPRSEDVSCRDALSSCELSLRCSSDSECTPGTVCCANDHTASCVQPSQCMPPMVRHLGCETSSECGPGKECCIHITNDATTFTSVSCEDDCSAASGGGHLCETDAECKQINPNLVCNTSWVLPNIKVCWPQQ